MTNDQQEFDKPFLGLQGTIKRYITLLIGFLIGLVAALIIFFFFRPVSFSPQGGEERFKEYGKCISVIPATGNFLRVDVTLKGKNIRLPEFEWDEKDYTSKPGCFISRGDIISMSNYIDHDPQDSLISLFAAIRSTVYDNEFEFSAKVFNRNNELIGKYPADTETHKEKVVNIKYPATINKKVKIK